MLRICFDLILCVDKNKPIWVSNKMRRRGNEQFGYCALYDNPERDLQLVYDATQNAALCYEYINGLYIAIAYTGKCILFKIIFLFAKIKI